MNWEINEARQQFSELLAAAAKEPQLIVEGDQPVAAIISPELFQEFLSWQQQRDGISTESFAPRNIEQTELINFSDLIAQTNLEIKRLGWTNDQGRQHLLTTYGKRSRQLLSDEELMAFLEYLRNQPTPE